ncbi:MAG TPA: hypothetical protein VJ750_10805 [Rhizomicrobium sp.]|nr:hypothetical protein [Rhizomicrobium sp.]
MKQVLFPVLLCLVFASPTVAPIVAEDAARAPSNLLRVSDPGLCLDNMLMDPYTDGLPVPIAVEGGCRIPDVVISI